MRSERDGHVHFETIIMVASLLAMLVLAGGCRSRAEPEVALPVDEVSSRQETAQPEGVSAVSTEETVMVLRSRESKTEYCPRSIPFTPPDSLNEIIEPAGGMWQSVQPGREVDFFNYDNVRVRDRGEAVLDLGNFMHLVLKAEAVIQSGEPQAAIQQWEEIRIEAVDTPPLQELILNVHLLRGGFSGRLDPGSGPIALTTPNAVIIVSGTDFFVAFDPAEERTWVGNFEGTIHIGDVPADEQVELYDQRLMAIPPFQGERFYELPPDLNEESFAQLVDLTGSPLDAAATFTGPIVTAQVSPGLTVFNEPSRQSRRLGLMQRGTVAPILSHIDADDGGYWQIVCPFGIDGGRQGCWVSDDPAQAGAYNVDDVPEDASTVDRDGDGVPDVEDYCPDNPAGDHPNPERPGCPDIDSDGDGWFNYEDQCPDEPAGRYPHPNHPGCPDEDPDRDGYPYDEDQCPYEPAGDTPDPNRTGCPAIDSDGDGWFDYEDECWDVPEGENPDPYAQGCPAIDSDGDGWFDYEDECWDVPQGEDPDPARPGCPILDLDRDGVPDDIDQCPEIPEGEIPEPSMPGCPAIDSDEDGWFDYEDQCPDEPAEVYPDVYPDPTRPGCPVSDRDGDGWFDHEDLCPDEPDERYPDVYPDPTRPGCPASDRDGDGWFDYEDQCPDEPAGSYSDPERVGCPWLRADLIALNSSPSLGGAGFCRLDGGNLTVYVSNRGDGEAPDSEVAVTFFLGGGENHTIRARTGRIPAGGTSAPIYVDIPGACFNPDCDFSITVDAYDEVEEIDEGNNVVDGWCLG